MKNLKRVISLILVLVCVFSCFSLECFAYHNENYKRNNARVNSVTCKIVNDGPHATKGWFGKVTYSGTEIALKNEARTSSSFNYRLTYNGRTLVSGKVMNGRTAYITLPKGSTGKTFYLILDQSTNFTINYSAKITGDVHIWQTQVNKIF